MPVNEKGRYLKVFKCGQLVYGNDTGNKEQHFFLMISQLAVLSTKCGLVDE
jgi:hypothetical protein